MDNYFQMNLTKQQINAFSNLGLAHIGDGVYELLCRSYLCAKGEHTVDRLHKDTVQLVKAPTQAQFAEKILPHLTEEELSFYRRGKNAHVHALLNELHAAGDLQKTYHARVLGCPEADSGCIDAPIARRPLPSLLRYENQEGKPSLTRYRVLEKDSQTALLELQPVTGRTHQLRVHCAHMGWPILGDPQYGSPESLAYSRERGFTSQLLCARRLEFIHPVTHVPLCLESGQHLPD